ncbi:hypothetical protein [Ralstonia sp. SET104]|uniref:hypothetical protein n=1 Tax=Ralstonia sp. SET104 TaxID=2448774 RepID=UPI000F579F05|nr:hypothetical protein [Ralstonia sp. SET104]GCB03500.1 hypothetical protein PSUB009319_11310 [Ralstonia sp. SET104]
MQNKLRTYLLAIAAAAMTVACGGGGGDNSSAANTGGSGSSDEAAAQVGTTADAACFALPATGKTANVTATSTVPVEVDIVSLSGAGAQTLEGQAYPALDVRNRIDQITGSDQHHMLYMLAGAPFLPAGAKTYADTDPEHRYAYTYTRMTLEQLRDAVLSHQASVSFNELAYSNVKPVVPALADFQLNTPVTLLMLEKRAQGTDSLPSTFMAPYVNELTVTYAGREDVTVGSTVYTKACKMDVSLRRTDYSFGDGTPFSIGKPVNGSA